MFLVVYFHHLIISFTLFFSLYLLLSCSLIISKCIVSFFDTSLFFNRFSPGSVSFFSHFPHFCTRAPVQRVKRSGRLFFIIMVFSRHALQPSPEKKIVVQYTFSLLNFKTVISALLTINICAYYTVHTPE